SGSAVPACPACRQAGQAGQAGTFALLNVPATQRDSGHLPAKSPSASDGRRESRGIPAYSAGQATILE
ncbi:MAG: hypothetical protein AAB942_00280, partial [Patescibacteria group bacterium]